MRVKFLRGKVYDGVSYGPGYPESVADVDPKWARIFISQGAAVAVDDAPLPVSGTLSTASIDVESRDPALPAPRKRGRK